MTAFKERSGNRSSTSYIFNCIQLKLFLKACSTGTLIGFFSTLLNENKENQPVRQKMDMLTWIKTDLHFIF